MKTLKQKMADLLELITDVVDDDSEGLSANEKAELFATTARENDREIDVNEFGSWLSEHFGETCD